ncbi:uncharacterized protein LOC106158935 [Lingula anatina]|uniref:Uncharacterized protein LOC106158935 n=1 Tax=Lingula anatina TaxID=7574 RepID=A0A1S3HY73_LINAN|nr:uncharacterized protein LOC106158935 [Lingula anatina]|eukprot:XP_013390516.1 uncharacterized protein LOC106158935 [Lingula anatina]
MDRESTSNHTGSRTSKTILDDISDSSDYVVVFKGDTGKRLVQLMEENNRQQQSIINLLKALVERGTSDQSDPPSPYSGKRKRGSSESLSVDKECRTALRDTYRTIIRHSSVGWNFEQSFTAPPNLAVTEAVVTEIRRKYSQDGTPKWSEPMINAACRVYYRSLRDDFKRSNEGTKDRHRERIRRNERLKRKLSRRQTALKDIDWSEEEKKKVEEILVKDFMSSDEEEDGGSYVKSLEWESETLRHYKMELDHFYVEKQNARTVNAMILPERNGGYFSLRKKPENCPSWASLSFT